MVFGSRSGSTRPMRQRTRSSLLIAFLSAALAVLPGCLNCFDDGELEASYRAGEASAQEVNEREFERGYNEGLALTYVDGERDGDADGYNNGYYDGYYGPNGYPEGFDVGYNIGHTDGFLDPWACTEGASRGYTDGDSDGYYAGFDEAYGPAWDDGYGAGFSDGSNSCGFRGASDRPDPKDLSTCETRGYEHNLDESAHPRGFKAGKIDNPEYQAGYAHAYGIAYPFGQADGTVDGYDAGYFDGYDSGWIDGYDTSFFLCYDQSYPDGFDAGYGIGWDEGVSVGYDEGYDAGYWAALEQCPE